MLFFLLLNVKMPTIVGILTFMSRKNFIFSWIEHENSFITLGPDQTRLCRLCIIAAIAAAVYWSKQRKLISPHKCAGWSEFSLFAHRKNIFSWLDSFFCSFQQHEDHHLISRVLAAAYMLFSKCRLCYKESSQTLSLWMCELYGIMGQRFIRWKTMCRLLSLQ